MIFDTAKPKSEYFDDPDIITDPKKQMALKMLGFNPNGTPTTWGKVLGWMPGLGGIGTNALANNIAKNQGATDTLFNTKQMMDNNINKQQTIFGVGVGIAGGLTGNTALMGQGIQTATEGAGSLASDQNDYQLGGGSTYMKKGGVLSNGSYHKEGGIDLVDNKSGEVVGEMEKNERIFSIEDNLKMEELAKAGKTKELGEFVKQAMDKHENTDYMKDGGKVKPKEGQIVGHKGFSYIYRNGEWHRNSSAGGGVGTELQEILTQKADTANKAELPLTEKDKSTIKGAANKAVYADSLNKGVTKLRIGRKAELAADALQGYETGDKIKIDGKEYHYNDNKGGTASWYDDKDNFAFSMDDFVAHKKNGHPFEDIKKSGEAVSKEKGNALSDAAKPTLEEVKKKGFDAFSEAAKNKVTTTPLTTAAKNIKSAVTNREAGATTPLATNNTPLTNNKILADDAFVTEAEHEPYWNALNQSKFDKDGNVKSYQDEAAAKTDGTGFSGSELLGYVPDIAKAALGFMGAGTKLPEYKVPQEWQDYTRKLESMSDEGLSSAQKGNWMRQLDRTYAFDVDSIEALSGGSGGVALGNLGAASYRRNLGVEGMNLADDAAQQQNLQNYGSVLGVNLDLSRQMFGDKYNSAMQTKMAGAQLAADSLSNIQGRADFNQTYGKGSQYQALMDQEVQSKEYLNSILKAQLEQGNVFTNNLTNNQIGLTSIPTTGDNSAAALQALRSGQISWETYQNLMGR